MSFVKNYISQAKSASREYRNYVGTGVMNANAYPGGGLQMGMRGTSFAAAGASNPASQSQPYIITISNASAAVVSNFDILGAYQYLQNTGFSNGTLTVSGIQISSNITNVNYQQFLYQSMMQPFQVGLTYIQSVAGATAQIVQSLTLNTQDANGNQAIRTLVPTYDPYQNLSNVVALQQAYAIDGFTKITISQVLASAVFQIQFYPAVNVNPANPISGQSMTQGYSQPYVVKALA
jgi:hypothetical protein